MRPPWFAVLVVAACYQPEAPVCRVSCASTGECPAGLVCGASDGLCHAPGAECSPVQPDAAPVTCYGTATPPFVQVCDPVGANNLVFEDGRVIDTTDGCTATVEQTGGPVICVIAAASITISAGTVRAIGPRPLLLLGTDVLQVVGRLDVASHEGSPDPPPAGANDGSCAISLNGNVADDAGGGGGAGGSFRAFGGNGGKGGDGLGLGGSGGMPPGQLPDAMRVRGGCPGGSGGSSDAVAGARGGSSGGAVYLMAGNVLMITGIVNASGAGAGAAKPETGGGGGGSGGMILLDAPSLVIGGTAKLFALGGSGSAGGRTDALEAAPGIDPLGPGLYAPGAVGASNGGAGGDGSAPVNPLSGSAGLNDAAGGGVAGGGGGGGGGAGGFIRVTPFQPIPTNVADPTPY